MNQRKIAINIFSSGAQVAIIGIIYFFLYRFLLKHLGIEILGVWSVVLATSSLANLANFGVGTSVLRYVALYSSDNEAIKRLIFTSSVFLLLLFIALSAIIYPFASLILHYVVGEKHMDVAISILPYSILCLVVNEVAGIYASVLDGLQKNYIRSIIFTSSTLILFSITYFLTPLYGIQGVAIGQVAQCLFTLISCLIILKITANYNPLKFNWDKTIFREIFSYGMKFQFLSITGMLCDPVTKMLLAKFGGLGNAGFYEMASRLVNQVKGVVVNANQALVPVIVNISKKNDDNAKRFYRITIIIIFYVSIMIFSFVALFSKQTSVIWINSDISFFKICVTLLCVNAFINLLCNPAYFSSIASGKLNLLIYSQLIMATGNFIFGYIGGKFFGGVGVALGWVIAASIGSLYLATQYQNENNIRIKYLFKLDMVIFLVSVIFIIGINMYLISNNIVNDYFTFTLAIFLFTIYILRGFNIFKNRRAYFQLV